MGVETRTGLVYVHLLSYSLVDATKIAKSHKFYLLEMKIRNIRPRIELARQILFEKFCGSTKNHVELFIKRTSQYFTIYKEGSFSFRHKFYGVNSLF